jgi:tetratricopeptide (TPR) repeat protein
MVDGLADYTAKIARWVSRGRQSMWTVLYSSVADAQLPDAKAATGAFGVNRVIVGDVQRVGASPRVRLKLQDAKTGRVLEQASIRCDVDSNAAVLDSLPRLLEKWFEVKPKALPRGSPWQTNAASAARPYLEGLCFSRRGAHDPDARDRALASLRASANMDSTFAMAQCAAGFAEMANYNQDGNRSRLARAINDARRSRRLVPSFTDANILLGNVFRALERPDSAEACYLQASREDPASASACERLGDLYAAQARLQESEQSYLAAMHANPDYWITHRTLGVFYFSQHRIDDAAAAWNDALKLAPNDIVTLNNLGVVHYYRGEWSQAQNIFLRSFQIRPDCNSCNNVATSLFLDGQFKESASYFELALSPQYCDSTDHVVLGNLASALYWVDGSRPRAVTLYRRAIHLATSELDSNPNSPDLIARLVDYYAMVGDSLQARAMIARAEPFLQKDSDVMYRVGSACEKLGDRALAMKHLANAVRHGYQWPLIRSDPSLRDLVKDGRFLKMINIDAAAEGASAATHTH